jgi:hypothetical protein
MTEGLFLHEEAQKMQSAGVVHLSNSLWLAPVVLTQKKDGSMWFCVDYHGLNSLTKKDAYPLPQTDNLINACKGSVYWSGLDLVAGYWQIPLCECDKEKTAFSVSNGLMEFNVLPFGLLNALGSFQCNMEALLKGLTWECCLVYLDDIIIFSKTFNNHLCDLQFVFD